MAKEKLFSLNISLGWNLYHFWQGKCSALPEYVNFVHSSHSSNMICGRHFLSDTILTHLVTIYPLVTHFNVQNYAQIYV